MSLDEVESVTPSCYTLADEKQCPRGDAGHLPAEANLLVHAARQRACFANRGRLGREEVPSAGAGRAQAFERQARGRRSAFAPGGSFGYRPLAGDPPAPGGDAAGGLAALLIA